MNEIFKQVRPGLFYTEYDDFDFDKAAEMTNDRYRPRGPMCSGIRKGSCIGRNADFVVLDKDILEMEAQGKQKEIFKVNVANTWFEGNQVYPKQ